MRFSQIDPQQPMVVYGRNISRHYDEEIAYQLKQRGHSTIYVLTGGLSAWQANGLDISP
jgi:3-mercaptopyruvate sulfurtransferase SseA